jgi:sigma-B regulation protein RsbU (phosphoserine phosphatase)
MRRLVFGFLLATMAAAGQGALYIDLSGEWRASVDDNPAYATPGFDDSAWRLAPLPRVEMPPVGTTWLRRQITVPEWAGRSELALTLGTFAEVYEVYFNGTRIGSTGAFELSETRIARPRTFVVPAGLAVPGRPATIALRIWWKGLLGPAPRALGTLRDEGPYLLTYPRNAPRDAAGITMLRREKLVTFWFVTCAVEALLALLLLAVWTMDRERRELWGLGFFLMLEMTTRLIEALSVALDLSYPISLALVLGVAASGAALAMFAFFSFRLRSRWTFAAIWAPTIIVGGFWAAFRQVPVFGSWRGWLFLLNWQITDIAVMALAVRAAWKAVREGGWRSGNFMLAVSIGMTALLHSQRLGAIHLIQLNRRAGGYLFHLSDIFIILLAVTMTVVLLRRMGADRRAKQRLEAEMGAARVVQQLLLQQSATGVDVAYLPAQEVGGDFYWTRRDADGSLLVLVGDVSGKGLKAAMTVTLIMGALRQRSERTPGEILGLLNRAVTNDARDGFVTACCVRLMPDGVAVIANAGHLAPYYRGNEVAVESSLPLGIDAETAYVESSLQMAVGESLILVSDGVVEAANGKGELFGFDRTREISTKPPAVIAAAAKAWGQNDDITVVSVRRDG